MSKKEITAMVAIIQDFTNNPDDNSKREILEACERILYELNK